MTADVSGAAHHLVRMGFGRASSFSFLDCTTGNPHSVTVHTVIHTVYA
ncbi:hypothetical protein [Methylobacterium oryzisoli]